MINWDKPIETVDGEPARVISTDYTGYDGSNSYIVQIEGKHFARLGFFKEDGKPHGSCDRIRNARVKREGWVRLINNNGLPFTPGHVVFLEKASAEAACQKLGGMPAFITWEEYP